MEGPEVHPDVIGVEEVVLVGHGVQVLFGDLGELDDRGLALVIDQDST